VGESEHNRRATYYRLTEAGQRRLKVETEERAADETLRYAEVFARVDVSFLLSNIPPGKYWLMARAAPDGEMSDRPVTPIAWDAGERAKLRREAMTAKNEIELQPCGRVKDYLLRFDR
jgi:DNA-binding MarR family transcriptional regulator